MTTQGNRLKAKAYARCWEIYCPHCDGENENADPIPAKDGSFLWDNLPALVKCPWCKQTFPVQVS